MTAVTSGPSQLSIDRRIDATAVYLVLTGDLDYGTRPALTASLDEAYTLGPAHVVIDLTELKFLDCAGLQALIYGRTLAQSRSGRLEIRNARGLPLAVLQLTGVLEYLSVLVV
jgi:anti-sigma B factor antagonist